jgi:hypothetical protein
MAESRFKYFPVIQNPEKARFSRKFVFINKRAHTDKDGVFYPDMCPPSLYPDANGIYVVDMESDHAKEKMVRMLGVVKDGIHPVIGPFDSIEDAVKAERKLRPLSTAEKLAQADANIAELEKLRQENARLKK